MGKPMKRVFGTRTDQNQAQPQQAMATKPAAPEPNGPALNCSD